MIYEKLNDMNISKVVLGTTLFGDQISENDCFRLLDVYKDFGGNCIDTANMYTGGLSEEIVGKWIADFRRDDVYISTKGAYHNVVTGKGRLTEKDIEEDLNLSLKRLNTDYIDLYWLHRDDKNKSPEEIIEILQKFIKQGKIRNIGASNWTAKRINEANSYAKEKGFIPFCASQIKWSLAETREDYLDDQTLVEMNDKEYNEYIKNGVPVFAFASLGKGFFSKMHNGGTEELPQKARARYLCEKNLKRLDAIEKIAEKYNITVGQAVTSYIYSNQDINSYSLIGSSSCEQLKDCIEKMCIIDEEDIKLLQSIK